MFPVEKGLALVRVKPVVFVVVSSDTFPIRLVWLAVEDGEESALG